MQGKDRFPIGRLVMSAKLEVGDNLFEDYKIFRTVSGSNSTIYCAGSESRSKRVAVKLCRNKLEQGSEGGLTQVQAKKLYSMDSHVNLLQVSGHGSIDGHIALITEYIEGETLREKMEADSISGAAFIDIMIQICSGIRALNIQGVIHGDIKPENIMVDEFGLVKIVDLDSSFMVDSDNLSKGTMPYNYDTGSNNIDLTALAIMILESLFGLKKVFALVPEFLLNKYSVGMRNVATYKACLSDEKKLKGVGLEEIVIKLVSKPTKANIALYDQLQRELLSAYKKVTEESINNEVAQDLANKALKLSHKGQLSAACEHLEEVAKSYNNEPHLWAILGSLYFNSNHYKRAMDASEKAIQLDPCNSRAWLNIGGCHNINHNYSKEQATYIKAAQYAPRCSDLWFYLSRSYLGNDKGELGWRSFGRGLMFDPRHSYAISTLSGIKEMDDDWSRYMLNLFSLYIKSSENCR